MAPAGAPVGHPPLPEKVTTGNVGADGWIRTSDLPLLKGALYVSYIRACLAGPPAAPLFTTSRGVQRFEGLLPFRGP